MAEAVGLAGLTLGQVQQLLVEHGVPSFRARQVYGWVFRSLVGEMDDMRNLPPSLRVELGGLLRVRVTRVRGEAVSGDGLSRKTLLELADGALVECVLMLYADRATACVSTQVGCAIRCPFCATGQGGLRRNLRAAEIVEQVLHSVCALRREGRTLTNIVFMGMGEPLANYGETWRAIRILNAPEGLGLGARHMTISTAGLAPQIRRMAHEELQVGLAVSLHAPSDVLRSRLVPINKRYPIAEVLSACEEYVVQTGRRVSYEYALIAGLNDSLAHASALGHLLRGRLCHVNLIPLNATAGSTWRAPAPQTVLAFQRRLSSMGLKATVRALRGDDVAAACGQLRQHHLVSLDAAGVGRP